MTSFCVSWKVKNMFADKSINVVYVEFCAGATEIFANSSKQRVSHHHHQRILKATCNYVFVNI